MANVYATKSGNWSDITVWNTGALPTSADNVYANTFNVNIDQNIDVISLRNNGATSITAGGTFTFNTGGVTANISNTIVMNTTVTTAFVLVTATTGLVTINIPNGIIDYTGSTLNITMINYSGNCNLTITCIKMILTSTAGSAYILYKTSLGNLVINAEISNSQNNSVTYINTGIIILKSNSNTIINGNLIGGNKNTGGAKSVYIDAGNLTINGDIIGGSGNLNGTGTLVFSSSGILNITGNLQGNISSALYFISGTVNITGTITGGTSNGVVGVNILGGTLNHIGVAQASAFGSAIFCGSPTTSVVTCTGPFLRNGYTVAVASHTLRINSLYNPYFEFRKSDTTNVTYVDQSTSNFPIELDVRDGISYASGLYTGTMNIPASQFVRIGVGVDNTVGTAQLTAQDFITALSTSVQPLAVRLQNVSTVDTTGNQISSYNI